MDSDFQLGDWLVTPKLNSLSCNGKAVRLEPKVMQVLVCLAETGDLVSKEVLMRRVWADTFVTDDVLTRSISELRKVFADDPKRPRYIQTVPKGGYRLMVPVRASDGQNGSGATPGLSVSVSTLPIATASPRKIKSRRVALLVVLAGVVVPLTAYLMVKHPLSSPQAKVGQNATKALPPPKVRTSVAVLPFKSDRRAGEDDFGVEVADALTTKLSESTRLAVIPTSTVLNYSDNNQDPAAAGKAMNVDYLLSGKIDRSRHNVTVQVIRIRDGVPLLAATLDQRFNDIFDLEDSLCPRILHDLLVTLDHEDTQRLRKRYTENPQAYEAFLKAHYYMNKPAKEDKARSIRYFQKAIALDPQYAMAYAGLSDCYMRLGTHGVAPAEFVPKSRAAVMKALELDDTVAYAHSMLGRIVFLYDWDFTRAGREYQRALELQPALVHQWYASYLLVENRPADAEMENQKFSEFLPFAAGLYFPQYYFWVRRYDRAAAMLQKVLEEDPGSSPAHLLLGSVFEQQGRSADAIAEFQKAAQLSDGDAVASSLGHLYATLGRKNDALSMLQKLDQASQHRYVSPYYKALVYAGLGKKNEAIGQLEKAFAERSLSPPALRCDPRLDSLRAEPRFQDFVRSTGLPH